MNNKNNTNLITNKLNDKTAIIIADFTHYTEVGMHAYCTL